MSEDTKSKSKKVKKHTSKMVKPPVETPTEYIKSEDTKSEDSVEPSKVTWEYYVKSEVMSYLNKFLPSSVEGVVGIKYLNPVKIEYEGYKELDKTKANGVQIVTEFLFNELIDITEEK